ncbi:MAG: lipid hydroperoxide peroxidase [Gammaproteobacteria bacterium GWF2_41_13]|nr:MAG: lipid hydroperoxide peroxidase [Gammaproteobacteria bacterium GWF2_41_13]
MDIKTITRNELLEIINENKEAIIVDVLDRSSYEKEHIPKAISIPLAELAVNAEKILPNKQAAIIVYCVGFECLASTQAVNTLVSLGYVNVMDYKGGLQDYREANLPMETGSVMKNTLASSITLKGLPLTLVGRKLTVNKPAPNFVAVNNALNRVTLDDFKGKVKVLTSFLSLDTPVCDLQVKAFNQNVTTLYSDVVVLGISKDLPFAQERFCALNHIDQVTILSDYQRSSFGINYGLLIKENNLLARAVIILDANDHVRYIQIIDEVTHAPNYEDALDQLNKVVHSPPLPKVDYASVHCIPCEEGMPPLEHETIVRRLQNLSNWECVEDLKLVKTFQFKDFIEAKYFLDLLSCIAEEQGHHPIFNLAYNKLRVTLTTHAAGGLTDNDFLLAKIIDEIT